MGFPPGRGRSHPRSRAGSRTRSGTGQLCPVPAVGWPVRRSSRGRTEVTSELGPSLRRARRSAGLTQEQLSAASGISVRTISRLENGADENVRLDTLRLLTDALGLTPAERRELMAGVVAGEAAVPTGPLAVAAQQLAEVLRGRWLREVEARAAHHPFPLPVRWRAAPGELVDHWANVLGAPPGAQVRPVELAGDLGQVVDVYRSVPSGRLVVLGRAGAGKSVLALRFALDHLDVRAPGDPVPVLFSVGAWDPSATGLRDWLVARLLRDHPDLAAPAPDGTALAGALVDAGRVLPVLDGFDEIAGRLRGPALTALSATSLPVLLTSRPDEYRDAVERAGRLSAAAGIRIEDLTVADSAEHLRRSSRAGRWEPVLTALRERPGDPACVNLTAVLGTPLMVVLARSVHGDTGEPPEALLDRTRFPTARELERHLLDRFVPTAYGPHTGGRGETPQRARRWLGNLARHLERLDTPDLAWWQLESALGRPARLLGAGLVSAVTATLATLLVFLPQYVVAFGFERGLRAVLVEAVLFGPVVGLGVGLAHAVVVARGGGAFEPSRVRVRLSGWRGPVFARRGSAGFLGGVAVGIAQQPASLLALAVLGALPGSLREQVRMAVVDALVLGLVYGVAVGAVFALTSVLEAPVDLDAALSPSAVLRTDRTTVLSRVAVLVPVFVLAIAFGGTLVTALLQPLVGPLVWPLDQGLSLGLTGALTCASAYVFTFTAWGRWLLFTRFWLPLTGRLPWSVLGFLDDARRRGVLRRTGAVHQFRHARLQDQLAEVAEKT
ncbi:XRE family transcriptional regulator [Actinosynnema pretiosum subsp. pretiosum]|uniref:XRE family transcriptional regulator n=1 Tax=Actinosynnema pretiosum subsp. pretiosum TaxID=103721 RepID=A0AA45R7G9_9PSEU|nr:XRE family transcriptional regulator [Actinosynnema pretiosum subsp. pretiosum]